MVGQLFCILTVLLLALPADAREPPVAGSGLVVYYSWDDRVARVVLDEFERETGIRVSGMRRSTRHLVKIIEAERAAPVASVVMAGPAPSYAMMKQAGLLVAYPPKGASAIPAEFRDPDDTWTGFYLGVVGFATDTRKVKSVPESYSDLVETELPRGLTYSNPATSGTAYTFLLALIEVMGEEEAFAFLERVNPRVVEFPSGGAMTVRLVELGEADVAVSFSHDILRVKVENPWMALSFPHEGTGWEVGGAALLAGAPHPEQGKRLLDFLVRPRTQELIHEKGDMPVYPTHPEAAPPALAPPLDSIKRVSIRVPEAGRRWDERSLRWNRRFPRMR